MNIIFKELYLMNSILFALSSVYNCEKHNMWSGDYGSRWRNDGTDAFN